MGLSVAPRMLSVESWETFDRSNLVDPLPSSVALTVRPVPFDGDAADDVSPVQSHLLSLAGQTSRKLRTEIAISEEKASTEPHKGTYALAVADEYGLHPLEGAALSLLADPKWRAGGHMLVGVRDDILQRPSQDDPWVSGSGIVGYGGLALFNSAYVSL